MDQDHGAKPLAPEAFVTNWQLKILRRAQRNLLFRLGPFLSSRDFYLAGGTAIALYLGHRRSVDLDWFSGSQMGDSERFVKEIQQAEPQFIKNLTSRGTVHGIDTGVKTSFLEFRFPLLQPLVSLAEANCTVASLDDLAAMKLAAIMQRGKKRDFVDMYALALKHRPLSEMLELFKKKFETKEIYHVLLGLTYFEDAEAQRMPPLFWDIQWKHVKESLRKWVDEATD
jgi:predicted nucleotidyltransferase component of viral defense system